MRDTLFISHALPEDNEFAKWLAARLRNEGYKVWCELDEVHGGEDFWDTISAVIRNDTIKFIFVGSHTSVQKLGVLDEWKFARSIQREYKLEHFIIPINLDGISSNAIIGLTGLAMLHFYNSWASGLKALIRKLQKDDVPYQTNNSPLSAAHWLVNPYALKGGAIKKEEIFYSNWLDLPQIPDHYFIHEFLNKSLADKQIAYLRQANIFPVSPHDRYIISFASVLPEAPFEVDDISLFNDLKMRMREAIVVDVKAILNRSLQTEEFPTTLDRSNFLVQLLRQAFHEFLIKKGLKTYFLSNNKVCYYYSRDVENQSDKTIKFTYQDRPKSKQLTGKFLDDVWHYGITFNPRLRPYPSFSFKGHILFSKDGQHIWPDKKKLHSARRKKGKQMYNAAWRDLWLAFLNSLADDSNSFHVIVTDEIKLWFSTTPILFFSKRGYNDPIDNARLVPLDAYETDDEDNDDFSEDFAEEGVDYEIENDEEKVDTLLIKPQDYDQ
ncbi:toll/interleukin-1 receptor domain-containing protein [Spirosoma jeollabukense]